MNRTDPGAAPNSARSHLWRRKLAAAMVLIAASVPVLVPDILPRPVRDALSPVRLVPPSVRREAAPENGWVFAGYTDKAHRWSWASDQRIALVRPSPASDRPEVFRSGDVVRPIRTVPQVIADYRARGRRHQMTPPWQVTEVIKRAEDFTGVTYDPEVELEVMDVSVSQLPGRDYAVWLRVTPLPQGPQ